jgi:hypothetical protein
MRSFNFKAKLIGEEKYLTYIMGEETELDEDVLDYCEENDLKELVKIIYEEDDDYDYLTYDITGRHTVDELLAKEMQCSDVLLVLRNIANGLISLKEQAVKLNYILLNRQFMYVDESLNVVFICLPVESNGSLATEFKGFVRQFLANIRYDVDEDLNYVGKLLTYINGDSFNLRGLVGLAEALMEEEGISFEEAGGIETDGVEVMNSEEVEPETDSIKDFMESFDKAGDEPLPEIGDDEEDEPEDEEIGSADDEIESILPAGMKIKADETDELKADEVESAEDDESADVEKAEEVETATVENVSDSAEDSVEDNGKEETAESSENAAETENVAEETDEAEKADEETAEAEKVAEKTVETEAATKETADTDVAEEKEETEEKAEEAAEEKGSTENLKAKEELPKKTLPKETDPEVLKNRIKALAGQENEKPKASAGKGEAFKSEQEMNSFFENKPPVIKKNAVKVNRAAIIQNIAASEEEAEAAKAKEEQQVPVIEEIAESGNKEKVKEKVKEKDKDKDKKPKSNSILSKTVEQPAAPAVNVVNIAKAMPYLVRVNTDERIMLRKEVFKIGKAGLGVDYTVSGNGAISRLHAVITRKDDVSYIKDNKSTNHTYVNDKMVDEGEEVILTHDSHIRLGDEEFIFKIR